MGLENLQSVFNDLSKNTKDDFGGPHGQGVHGGLTNEFIKKQFNKSQSRGPEKSAWKNINDNTLFGFHRLAINGLNNESDQPLIVNNCLLICNGEIYNYKQLYERFPKNTAKSDSDCEIIIHMYKKYGINYTLNNLDGVFAFILYDMNENKMFISRDPYGVRPLFQLKQTDNKTIGYASELKQLSTIKSSLKQLLCTSNIKQFTPGTYTILKADDTSKWNVESENNKYTTFGFATLNNEHPLSYNSLIAETTCLLHDAF